MIHLRILLIGLTLAASLLRPDPASAQGGPSAWPARGTRPGCLFPNLPFPRLEDGELTRLSAFRGKRVLLIQFASW